MARPPLTEQQRRFLEALEIPVFTPEDGPARAEPEPPAIAGTPAADAPAAVTAAAGPPPVAAPGEVPPTPEGDGAEEMRRARIRKADWEELEAMVSVCVACPLSETRTQTVFGVGDRKARWLFVGEAPGAEEDRRGEPFVGRAGQLLDAMLKAIGLKRGEDVYIANILKCRPPNNRDPLGFEVQQCLPHLERQVELLQPRLIVALGRFAAQGLLQVDTPLNRLRGTTQNHRGIPVMVTYHPAYLLRNPIDKRRAWEDLQRARALFDRLVKGPA